MVTKARTVEIAPGSELARLLDDPAGLPVELVKDGVRYRLDRADSTSAAIEDEEWTDREADRRALDQFIGSWKHAAESDKDWEGYDPTRVEQVLDEVEGTWSDEYVDRLKATMRRAREEGSRPWDRPGPL